MFVSDQINDLLLKKMRNIFHFFINRRIYPWVIQKHDTCIYQSTEFVNLQKFQKMKIVSCIVSANKKFKKRTSK